MKTLSRDMSIEDIGRLNLNEAMAFKNKFLEFKFLDAKVFVLRFFLNPYTKYSKFKGTVTKRVKKLYYDGFIWGNDITLIKEESVNSIRSYYYQIEA